MELDADRCYQALLSRDARFDGSFFVGVLTTGIYCRPICPAGPARPQNIRYYPSAAAAAAAGLRPCRRCHPESAPGTPAWRGTSATVVRALALIEEGALDGALLEDLAGRLGVGSRHLRRLFAEHVGGSPLAVARARRLAFARELLGGSELPMIEVAEASGFASLRRFNAAVRAAFGEPPGAIRARGRRGAEAPASELTLRLAYRPPYAWEPLIGFLGGRALPGIELVTRDCYRRSLAWPGGSGVLEVRPAGSGAGALILRLPARAAELRSLVERVRRLFDLAADPAAIAARLAPDPLLAPAFERWPGLRVPGAWDGFEIGVRAVLGQQVSVRGATTLSGRLVERFGRRLEPAPAPGLTHAFPEAATLAAAEVADIAGIGLPTARAACLRALAAAVQSGELSLEPGADGEATRARLLALPGIGPWTADYIALRALGAPDAFPEADLVLDRALAAAGARDRNARRASTAGWSPWRAYAALALWYSAAAAPAAAVDAEPAATRVARSAKRSRRAPVPDAAAPA